MEGMCEIREANHGTCTAIQTYEHMERSAGDMTAIKEEMSEKQLVCGRSACQIIISQFFFVTAKFNLLTLSQYVIRFII